MYKEIKKSFVVSMAVNNNQIILPFLMHLSSRIACHIETFYTHCIIHQFSNNFEFCHFEVFFHTIKIPVNVTQQAGTIKYCKFPKYSDAQKICCNHSKI